MSPISFLNNYVSQAYGTISPSLNKPGVHISLFLPFYLFIYFLVCFLFHTVSSAWTGTFIIPTNTVPHKEQGFSIPELMANV